jgi:AGZA family xanthine/uracil permease-like MFS transporter
MKYPWFVRGDVNGFFGLMFDNLTVLSFLAGILIFAFQYPAQIVYTKMFPGTALAVLFGNLCYTWMAVKLRERIPDPKRAAEVTAMPLGLDTPSTIGIALTVLGPCFLSLKARGMEANQAAILTWHVGMAVMIMIGILKLVLSFFGEWVRRIVPQAGLLGSLAGIGMALIGFIPLTDVFSVPVVGLVALGLIFYNLVAGRRLPFDAPGVLVAVGLGTILYYALGSAGWLGVQVSAPHLSNLQAALPLPTLGFIDGFHEALRYLPIALPFGLLTVAGGVNVTESARVAGDDYKTRDILLVEAGATLLAGLFGGVAQSTPYIGQPAYKAMGSRVGFTLATGLFIGLGGVLGYVSFIVELIPRAALAPILIFVALDIISQAFLACPAKHAAAVGFSFLPSVARLLQIKVSNPDWVPAPVFASLMAKAGNSLPEMQVIVALGNGFILTAMLWGAFLAVMVDGKLRHTACYLVVLAAMTFFGIIHSAMPDGNMYLPWTLAAQPRLVPYEFAAGYLALAAMIFIFSFSRQEGEPLGGH